MAQDKIKLALVTALALGAAGVAAQRYATAKRGQGGEWVDADRDTPSAALPTPWPPAKGQVYPDIVLPNPQGEMVRLSNHKGKVIIVEPIGMSCPACQAFAGAHDLGSLNGVHPQSDLPSFREIASEAGLDTGDANFLWVHLLLYDPSSSVAPTLEQGRSWAEHFDSENSPNTLVLVADERYINRASYNLVPGFHLIDQDFVLRRDSSGHQPIDSYDEVAELAASLLD